MEGANPSMNNPNHEVNGPGITGRKLPAIPRRIKNPARDIMIKSIR
jgi:hypothetical protein